MARGAMRVLMAVAAVLVAGATAGCGGPPGSEGGTPTPTLEGTGVVGTGAGGDDEITCTAPNDTPGVAIIADADRLVLADGRAFPLTGMAGEAIGGYQTCDGWLVHVAGPGRRTYALWLARTDGSLTTIVAAADAPVAVAPDGRHIAWRWEGELLAGRVNPAGGAVVDVTSPAPERGHPITMSSSVVVLGYSATGGGIDHHDFWSPERGDYVPTWDAAAHVRLIYGPAPDGEHFLGLVADPASSGGTTRLCLAEFDPGDGLSTSRTACGLAFALDRFHDVDPDGRRLAVIVADESGERALGLVDLTTVFRTPAFDAVLAGPAQTAAFEDAAHLLVVDTDGGLRRFAAPFDTATAASRPGVNSGTEITALLSRLV